MLTETDEHPNYSSMINLLRIFLSFAQGVALFLLLKLMLPESSH